MKAAALYGVKDLRTVDMDRPSLAKGDVLIAVNACGICGTDVHIFRGEWKVRTPLVLGHEFSGTVVQTGSAVPNLVVGDRVVAEPNVTCGQCSFCRMSDRNFYCENIQAIGVSTDGAFAEYVRSIDRCWPKDSSSPSSSEPATL